MGYFDGTPDGPKREHVKKVMNPTCVKNLEWIDLTRKTAQLIINMNKISNYISSKLMNLEFMTEIYHTIHQTNEYGATQCVHREQKVIHSISIGKMNNRVLRVNKILSELSVRMFTFHFLPLG